MSQHLAQGAVTTDVDGRIANLVTAYTADTENPERDTVLWLLENWAHDRAVLRDVVRLTPFGSEAHARALQGLEVVGE